MHRRRRVSVVRRRRDASLRYVGRTYETAGQQDLTTRELERATVFLLDRSHLETSPSSLKTSRGELTFFLALLSVIRIQPYKLSSKFEA